MSDKTWLKEYYPVPPHRLMTPLEATQHALRKWSGLRFENRKRHKIDVSKIGNLEYKETVFLRVTSSTCALCEITADENDDINCKKCPIYKFRGGRCDHALENEILSPYHDWHSVNRNPETMIELLTKVEAYLKEQEG